MKNIIDSIRQALRSDQFVLDLVGLDDVGEVKVYEEVARSDITPPYAVWTVMPGGDIARAYDDAEAIQEISIQITAWAQNPRAAWQLSEALDEVVKNADYNASPWVFMGALRIGFPQPLPDRESNLRQVATPYALRFSSGR